MKLHDLLKSERKRLKISQTDAAHVMSSWNIDVSTSTISRIESGWPASWDVVNGYCRLFGWSLADLEKSLRGDLPISDEPILSKVGSYVPIVSWVNAGNWGESPNIAVHEQNKIFITGKLPKNTFALRVSGESMTNCDARETFPDGCLILVDPGQIPKSRDFVVAVDDSTQDATFKELIDDCGKMYLKPLNTQYPVMETTESTTIKGVVFRKIEDKII